MEDTEAFLKEIHSLVLGNEDITADSIEMTPTSDDKGRHVVLIYIGCQALLREYDDLIHFSFKDTALDNITGSTISSDVLNKILTLYCTDHIDLILIIDCSYNYITSRSDEMESNQGRLAKVIDMKKLFNGSHRVILSSPPNLESLINNNTGSILKLEKDPISISSITPIIIKGLCRGKADFDGNGKIEAMEMFRYILEQVEQTGAVSKPSFSMIGLTDDVVLAQNVKTGDQSKSDNAATEDIGLVGTTIKSEEDSSTGDEAMTPQILGDDATEQSMHGATPSGSQLQRSRELPTIVKPATQNIIPWPVQYSTNQRIVPEVRTPGLHGTTPATEPEKTRTKFSERLPRRDGTPSSSTQKLPIRSAEQPTQLPKPATEPKLEVTKMGKIAGPKTTVPPNKAPVKQQSKISPVVTTSVSRTPLSESTRQPRYTAEAKKDQNQPVEQTKKSEGSLTAGHRSTSIPSRESPVHGHSSTPTRSDTEIQPGDTTTNEPTPIHPSYSMPVDGDRVGEQKHGINASLKFLIPVVVVIVVVVMIAVANSPLPPQPTGDQIPPPTSQPPSSTELGDVRFVNMWGEEGSAMGEFELPYGLAFDSSGRVFVADRQNDRIQIFDPDGGFIDSIGQQGTGNGEFDTPSGLALDSLGNLYVSDRGNDRIQVFRPDGSFRFQLGQGMLEEPSGIAIGDDGRIFAVDHGNHRIQVFDREGNFLLNWGQERNDNGTFNNPHGIAIGPNGRIFITDFSNDRIQVFEPDGTFIFQWGEEGSSAGQFESPYGIDITTNGTIYVSEYGNNRVQMFSLD